MLCVNRTVSGLRCQCETLLHAHCWTIIERIIGHQAEDRLDLLFQAMRDGWGKNSYDVSGLILPSDHEDGRKLYEVNGLRSDLIGGERWLGDRVLKTTYHQYRIVPVTDPIDIPTLRTLIAESMKSVTSKDRIEEPSGSEEDTKTIQPVSTIMSRGPATMPVEIRALILNQLPEWLDVKDALEAFSWEPPESLWRYWFPHDLIFDELDGIPISEINWKVLHAGIMRLLGTSLAMKNRQRIVRVVKETREDFLELLKQN